MCRAFKRNALGLGSAADRAGVGLDTVFVLGCGRGDHAVAPDALIRHVAREVCRRIAAGDLRCNVLIERMRRVIYRHLFVAGIILRLEIAVLQCKPDILLHPTICRTTVLLAGNIDSQVADIPHCKIAVDARVVVEVDRDAVHVSRTIAVGVVVTGSDVGNFSIAADVQRRPAIHHLEVLRLCAGRACIEIADRRPVEVRRHRLVCNRHGCVAAGAEENFLKEGANRTLVVDLILVCLAKAQLDGLFRSIIFRGILLARNEVAITEGDQGPAESDIIPVADEDQRVCTVVEDQILELGRTAERKNNAVLRGDKAGVEARNALVRGKGDFLFISGERDVLTDDIAVKQNDLTAALCQSAHGFLNGQHRVLGLVAAIHIVADSGAVDRDRIVNINRGKLNVNLKR